jgi:hypothetical protein
VNAVTTSPQNQSGAARGDADVLHWRFEQLRRAGYSEHDASLLARHTEVDLHLATELPRKGCPHATALRIVL